MPGGDPATALEISFWRDKKYPNVVSWRYDGKRYLRAINGQPHLAEGGTRIAADNIIVLVAPHRVVRREEVETEITITGQGPAMYFVAGRVFRGTWRKTSPQDHFQYTLPGGQEMKFHPGQTWVEIVASLQDVAVKR